MKKTKQFISLLLAVIFVFSLVGCKKTPEELSSDYEVEYVDEYVYVDGTTSDGVGDSNENKNGSGNKKPSSSSTNNVDKDKYRGKTIRYATWADPQLGEDGPVVKAFEKEYGVKVQIDLIGEGVYINTIAGMVASNNSPDVFFCNSRFPACLSVLQPLQNANIDLTDPIWDKGMIDISTINGKTYLINTVGNIWGEVDCVFYNKRLLKENNITTPDEYYKAGKWTFDAMMKVMRDVKAIGPDYVGGFIDWEPLLASTGAAYFNWENGKFSNGTNPMLTEVTKYLSTCLKDGLISGVNDLGLRDEFTKGKAGIALTNAYGLKKIGFFAKMNPDDIGFTYIPDYSATHKASPTALFRGWGIIKGAKEPEAAGAFLRYYHDVNNYNTSSAFINKDAETFFFKLTSGISENEKKYYFTLGAESITGTKRATYGDVAKNDPTQVASIISSLQNVIDADVKMLNAFVQQQTK